MQGMRDLLRTSLARSLSTLSELDRLAAALPVVCGQALAGHCEVDRLDESGVLHLNVQGREWLTTLLTMREVLQNDLGRTAGVRLSGLHFEASRSGRQGADQPAKAAADTISAGAWPQHPAGLRLGKVDGRRRRI